MAVLHPDSREIQFKVVFCGPPRGGKTTNLSYIYRKLDPHFRGDLVSIATEQDRTICFDYLPVNSVEIAGYQTRFQLYTVPGQQVYRGTRDTVLNGADGVVFVADSSPDRFEASVEAYNTCVDSFNHCGLDASRVPLIFQYNKRDIDGATPPEDFDEVFGVTTPSFLACALSGYQVFATLDYLTQLVIKEFHRRNVSESDGRLREDRVGCGDIAIAS